MRIPPKRAISDLRPSPRCTVASKQLRGPCGLSTVALRALAIAVTVGRRLAASILSIEVSMTRAACQAASVLGKEVVRDEPAILGHVCRDHGEIVVVEEGDVCCGAP